MRSALIPFVGVAALGAVFGAAQPTKAACYDVNDTANNCDIVTPFTPPVNDVKLMVQASTLPGTLAFQFGFDQFPATGAGGTAYGPITNVRWSTDDVTYTPLAFPGFATGTTESSTYSTADSARYSNVINLSTAIPSGGALYFRYTLPTSGIPDGSSIGAYVRTNDNGALDEITVANSPFLCGLLAGTATPCPIVKKDPYGTTLLLTSASVLGDTYTYNHMYHVPGPVPLLGAAAAFSASRRLRRRIKAAA